MSEDFLGKRKKYYLDRVVNSKSETIRAKEVGRCVGRSLVRFGAKHFTTRSQGGDFWSVGGGYQFAKPTLFPFIRKACSKKRLT